jgi:hypothetical protein
VGRWRGTIYFNKYQLISQEREPDALSDKDKIFNYLKSHKSQMITANFLAKTLNIGVRYIRKVLEEAVSEDRISFKGTGRSNDPRRFYIE